MRRRSAYAPKGKRVYGLVAGQPRPRPSLIAARIGEGLAEPVLLEGPCNADGFTPWLERQLCPLLNDTHVVVMDNAPFPTGQTTRNLIQGRGAVLLYLPPYSPDLNPIEKDFGAIKKIREYKERQTLDNLIKYYQ